MSGINPASARRAVARKLAMQALYRWQINAGPWQDAPDCSQMPIVARLPPMAAPEPPLDPRTTRSVSYGLHACPLHELTC